MSKHRDLKAGSHPVFTILAGFVVIEQWVFFR
jgi:hypothetical protein